MQSLPRLISILLDDSSSETLKYLVKRLDDAGLPNLRHNHPLCAAQFENTTCLIMNKSFVPFSSTQSSTYGTGPTFNNRSVLRIANTYLPKGDRPNNTYPRLVLKYHVTQ